ncbi:class F sortase [Kribbella sp. NPDC004875]|uniref:class F sortase n=1 Tax=Kribbella sp. NPDC004875 TaxID=3364107 RepID=UPI00368BA989
MIRPRGAAVLVMAALPVLGLAGCAASDGVAGDRSGRAEQSAPVAATPRPAASPPAASTAPPAPRPGAAYGGIRTHPAVPSVAPTTARPLRLRLASVGIDVPVVPVGVAPDGQMALPPNPATIGWYEFGPGTTAARGSVVLGGHVDSLQYGVGPLVRLRGLQTGASVVVGLTDGTSTTYRVQSVQDIPKAGMAFDQVFDREGPRLLRIITCGGPYDRGRGGYQDNLVVVAVPA